MIVDCCLLSFNLIQKQYCDTYVKSLYVWDAVLHLKYIFDVKNTHDSD